MIAGIVIGIGIAVLVMALLIRGGYALGGLLARTEHGRSTPTPAVVDEADAEPSRQDG